MKKLTWLCAILSLSMGLCACSEDDEKDTAKGAVGEACEANEDCESGLCGDDKKCAEKTAEKDKLENGKDCTAADQCKSNYCSEDKKCADDPAAKDKLENGKDCTAADQCKSNYCSEDKKCADDPAAKDKLENGKDCTAADQCMSNYCGDNGKCADKPADPSKLENGKDCTAADQCMSNYCGDNGKCADKPADPSKLENGKDCTAADQCMSNYCGDNGKCADKPAETGDALCKGKSAGDACARLKICDDKGACVDMPADAACAGKKELDSCGKNKICDAKLRCLDAGDICLDKKSGEACGKDKVCRLVDAKRWLCIDKACDGKIDTEECGSGKTCNNEYLCVSSCEGKPDGTKCGEGMICDMGGLCRSELCGEENVNAPCGNRKVCNYDFQCVPMISVAPDACTNIGTGGKCGDHQICSDKKECVFDDTVEAACKGKKAGTSCGEAKICDRTGSCIDNPELNNPCANADDGTECGAGRVCEAGICTNADVYDEQCYNKPSKISCTTKDGKEGICGQFECRFSPKCNTDDDCNEAGVYNKCDVKTHQCYQLSPAPASIRCKDAKTCNKGIMNYPSGEMDDLIEECGGKTPFCREGKCVAADKSKDAECEGVGENIACDKTNPGKLCNRLGQCIDQTCYNIHDALTICGDDKICNTDSTCKPICRTDSDCREGDLNKCDLQRGQCYKSVTTFKPYCEGSTDFAGNLTTTAIIEMRVYAGGTETPISVSCTGDTPKCYEGLCIADLP